MNSAHHTTQKHPAHDARSQKAHKPHATPPPPVNTPEERRKFLVLVILGCMIVILIWIATLPLNLRSSGPTAPGPTTLFGVIGQQLGAVSRIGDLFSAVSKAKQSQ